MTERWPHIRRGLHANGAGVVDDNFVGWELHARRRLDPAELAAAYEEWAVFYEWSLEQRTAGLGIDSPRYGVLAKWTDSMAYYCRRAAAWARGENPGEPVQQWVRRPDLFPPPISPHVDDRRRRDGRRLVAAAVIS